MALKFPLQLPHPSLALQRYNPLPLFPYHLKPPLSMESQDSLTLPKWTSSICSKSLNILLSGSLALALSFSGAGVAEAKVGVNKPELLPKEFSTVIDVAGFLSDGQEKRIAEEIAALEKDTGYKLRVLAQNYPDTPGLAIKDFWRVDDVTIVLVADPTFGNILNFNVGPSVDLDIPRSFWSRLAGKYGNMFYWKEKGEDASIESAVMAMSTCLREPVGTNNCSEDELTLLITLQKNKVEQETDCMRYAVIGWIAQPNHLSRTVQDLIKRVATEAYMNSSLNTSLRTSTRQSDRSCWCDISIYV